MAVSSCTSRAINVAANAPRTSDPTQSPAKGVLNGEADSRDPFRDCVHAAGERHDHGVALSGEGGIPGGLDVEVSASLEEPEDQPLVSRVATGSCAAWHGHPVADGCVLERSLQSVADNEKCSFAGDRRGAPLRTASVDLIFEATDARRPGSAGEPCAKDIS